jgi:hypothetical protein
MQPWQNKTLRHIVAALSIVFQCLLIKIKSAVLYLQDERMGIGRRCQTGTCGIGAETHAASLHMVTIMMVPRKKRHFFKDTGIKTASINTCLRGTITMAASCAFRRDASIFHTGF